MSTLVGRYALGAAVAEEGSSRRFVATDTAQDRGVLVDLYARPEPMPPEGVARLRETLEQSARLRSEHTLRMLDVGTTEEGQPFFVWEDAARESLAGVVARSGPLPIATAAGVACQACEAIAEAHDLGLLHLDLKPATLLVSNRAGAAPFVRVIGFGRLRAAHAGMRGMWGSPLYMAPERLRGAKTAGCDVWALGITLYELVSGRTPFAGAQLSELFVAILRDPPPPLASAAQRVPPAFEAVVASCLEKDPAKRPASARAIADALRPLATN